MDIHLPAIRQNFPARSRSGNARARLGTRARCRIAEELRRRRRGPLLRPRSGAMGRDVIQNSPLQVLGPGRDGAGRTGNPHGLDPRPRSSNSSKRCGSADPKSRLRGARQYVGLPGSQGDVRPRLGTTRGDLPPAVEIGSTLGRWKAGRFPSSSRGRPSDLPAKASDGDRFFQSARPASGSAGQRRPERKQITIRGSDRPRARGCVSSRKGRRRRRSRTPTRPRGALREERRDPVPALRAACSA